MSASMFKENKTMLTTLTNYRRYGILCLLVGLLLAGTVYGQETFGSLTGTITDPAKAVVAGARVTITNKATGRSIITSTGMDGTYSSGNIEPGVYSVKIETGAFQPVLANNVKILVGQRLVIDQKLNLKGVETITQVVSETPLLDFQNSQKAHNVTREELDRLPKARTFTDIARFSPSVHLGQLEGGIQINGASGGENLYTFDGGATSSLIYGLSRLDTIAEYIQEVQIKTGGMPAEFGGTLGGVISAISKSGTADFHGEFFYYYGGSGLSAGPVQRLQLNPNSSTDTNVYHEQDTKQPTHKNELGATLGGPMPFAGNKLFFFASASSALNRNTRNYLFQNGTEPGALKQKETTTQVFGKITYLAGRIRANGSFLAAPTRDTGILSTYKGTGENFTINAKSTYDPLLVQGYNVDKYDTNFNIDITLNRSSYISFRGGHFYDNYRDTGFVLTTPYRYSQPIGSGNTIGVPSELWGPTGTFNVPSANPKTQRDKTQRTGIDTDYNLLIKALGKHVFKAGAGIERFSYDVDAINPGGLVLISWDVSTNSVNGPPADRGTYGFYRVREQGVKGKVATNRGNFYIQDQWTPIPRLTLNVGVRAENERVPMFRADIRRYGYTFGFGDKLAPRIGGTYDVRGNGKSKLYASWGRYYDVTRYSIARELFGGSLARDHYRSLDTLDITSLNLNNMPGRDLWGDPRGYRELIATVSNVDPAIKPMYQDSTNVGFEYQYNRSTVLGVAYVHTSLGRAVEDIALNGSTFIVGNPGEGAVTMITGNGPTLDFAAPKARRQYDALQLTATKRLFTNFFGSVSYTYSRLFGNYSGIADTDDIRTPTTGLLHGIAQAETGVLSRAAVNGNLNYDSAKQMWDASGNISPLGPLATDRPHALKLYGGYTFPRQMQVALFHSASSGTPITTYVIASDGHPVMPNGRGDMGRTPAISRTDLLVSHEHKLKNDRKVRLELNLLNVLNRKTATHIFNFVNKGAPGGGNLITTSAINLTGVNLANGYDYNALILATVDGAAAYDPRYGYADLWQPGTQGQFSIKFIY